MNNDHTRMTAGTRANGCGRIASGWRAVRTGGAACMLALALALVGTVHAQDRGGFRKDDQQQQRDGRDSRGDNRGGNGQRQDVPRFEPRVVDDVHRQQQDRNAEAQRRSGRLTPDERRDLRRQINEAGVDLYPNTPRR